MSGTGDPAGAQVMAARIGVTLTEEAARDAAQSMAAVLAAAELLGRALPFEAEPGTYAAAQRRSRG
jgi:hypothetical protein